MTDWREIDLLSFLVGWMIGYAQVCVCSGYEHVKGPYPSGFCKDCGRWFPPKGKETS